MLNQNEALPFSLHTPVTWLSNEKVWEVDKEKVSDIRLYPIW